MALKVTTKNQQGAQKIRKNLTEHICDRLSIIGQAGNDSTSWRPIK